MRLIETTMIQNELDNYSLLVLDEEKANRANIYQFFRKEKIPFRTVSSKNSVLIVVPEARSELIKSYAGIGDMVTYSKKYPLLDRKTIKIEDSNIAEQVKTYLQSRPELMAEIKKSNSFYSLYGKDANKVAILFRIIK